MLDQDVKYLKFRSFLNTYCPHCHNSFNRERHGEQTLNFKAVYQKKEMDLVLSPHLDVFETDATVDIKRDGVLDDLICPKCKKSLVHKETLCGDCGSHVGEVIISAFSKF